MRVLKMQLHRRNGRSSETDSDFRYPRSLNMVTGCVSPPGGQFIGGRVAIAVTILQGTLRARARGTPTAIRTRETVVPPHGYIDEVSTEVWEFSSKCYG